jgi:predicted nucleic acid-binding protein
VLHFFIDTNVLLSFYSFTQDDLTRLEQLAAHVEKGTFVILTTSHVENEFTRNREKKIAESRKEIKSQRLDMNLPRLCDPYEQTKELRRLAAEYSQVHAALVAQIDEDAHTRVLRADQLIGRFFSGAHQIEVTSEIIEKARVRVELGNPPGKRGSIGDAVNWEALLAYRPSDELFFVTDDKDFYSPLDRTRAHEFLTSEWGATVRAPIAFVHRLSELPDSVPHEVLPMDDAPDERDELASALLSSVNFARTHALISALARIPRFTARQASDLVAALDNSQVGWILGDDDVHSFYEWLAETHGADLPEEELYRLMGLLSSAVADEPETDRLL